MSGERLGRLLLLLLMLVVAAVGWWFELRPELRVEGAHLLGLPERIGDWRGRGIPLESAVEEMLEADFNMQRVYRRDDRTEPIWLYVGYYGTSRGGRPEHTPDVCYPSAGWAIESRATRSLDPARDLLAVELVVSRIGERRLVHFWYRSSRRTGMADRLAVSLDHLRGRLTEGRAEGALVRVSTPLSDGDMAGARERLAGFARRMDPLLDAHWPQETPRG